MNSTEYFTGLTFGDYTSAKAADFKGYIAKPFEQELIKTDNSTVIKIYYDKTNVNYTVEYYYDNQKDSTKTEIDSELYGNQVTTYTDKVKIGYKLDEVVGIPLTISGDSRENVIKVYYVSRTDLSYTVNYLEQGTDKVLAPAKTLDGQTFGTEVTENAIDIEGYNKVDPTTNKITIAVTGNVINFYYTARTDLSYTVNYFYNGVENKDAYYTESNQTFGSSIMTYIDKSNSGEWTLDQTNSTVMPYIIGVGANIINVHYVKAVIDVEKTAPATADTGEKIEYTLKVSNTGLKSGMVNVVDTLPAGVVLDETTIGNGVYDSTNKTITWSNLEVTALTSTSIKFKVKINNDQIGKTIINTVTLSNSGTDTATTKINEKTLKVNEMKEGQTGESANIILVMDLSSSMNEPIVGQSYTSDISKYVAPSDVSKTRIYSAKDATKQFINSVYSDVKTADIKMSVVTFNTSTSYTTDTEVLTSECNHYYDYCDCKYATDKKYYRYEEQEIAVGTQTLRLTGTAITKADSTNYSKLVSAVNSLSIGSKRENYGTNIKPAFTAAGKLIDEYKNLNNNQNIVIILSDGAPNDINVNNAANNIKFLKDKGASVYSIGFGSAATDSSKNAYKILANLSSDGNVLTAQNTSTLLNRFKDILEAINVSKNITTQNGLLTITTTQNLVYPIKVYCNEEVIINCTSSSQLSANNLTYASNTITWNMNEYLKTHPSIDPTSKFEITYYIPRT